MGLVQSVHALPVLPNDINPVFIFLSLDIEYICVIWLKSSKYLCMEGSLYSFDFPSLVPTLDANVDVGDQ